MTDNLSSPPAASSSGPSSHFPAHDGPRVWVLSAGDSPIGISLTRQLLAHGDHVVAGITPSNEHTEDPRRADFDAFLDEVSNEGDENGSRGRLEPVELDIRCVSYITCSVVRRQWLIDNIFFLREQKDE